MSSGPEIAYGRLKADPGVGVGDLCGFMQKWFKSKGGARNVGGLIGIIDKSGIGWKAAPQVCAVHEWEWVGGRGHIYVICLWCLLMSVRCLMFVFSIFVVHVFAFLPHTCLMDVFHLCNIAF